MTGRIEDRVALVTGGSSGIGEAIVKLFAAEGAIVAFCGRDQDRGRRVEAEVAAAGGRSEFAPVNVASADEVAGWVDGVAERYGRIDIVVNNAAITGVGKIEAMALDDWQRLMDVNVTGMFLVTQCAIPHLRRAGGGSIVNLGSTFGVIGAPGSVAYGVTKAAAISFSKGLALELMPDRIRVNALCPAGTETPFSVDAFSREPDPVAAKKAAVAMHPMGRFSTSEEQAQVALFLVSDDASYVSGHAMMADGGYTAQ